MNGMNDFYENLHLTPLSRSFVKKWDMPFGLTLKFTIFMTFLCVFYNPKRLGQLLKKCQIMIIFLFQGGGSEQTSFLSLLDPDQPELKRKLRKKIKLDTQKIGN